MNLRDVKCQSPGCCRGKLSGEKSIVLLCLLAILALGVYGETIYSTRDGGLWSAPTTWVDENRPGENDDVHICGKTVSVNITARCKTLTIEKGCTLQGGDGLYVYGDITNNGFIKDPDVRGSLSIKVAGNIINNGEWSNSSTTLIGDKDQHISLAEEISFTGKYLYSTKSSGKIIAKTDLSFSGVYISLYTNVLSLMDYDLSVDGGFLKSVKIEGMSNEIELKNGAYLQSVEVESMDLQLKGNILVYKSVVFNTHTTVTLTSTLQNMGTQTLRVYGSMINNGFIKDNDQGGYLYINVAGDIRNNGEWSNYKTTLNGTEDQHISLAEGRSFTGESIYGNKGSGKIFADTDLSFINVKIYLQGDELCLPLNKKLSVDGGLLNNFNITANGNEIELKNGANLQLGEINGQDVKLKGDVLIYSGVTFNTDITVTDTGTLQDINGQSLRVYGGIINNGIIKNNDQGGYLYINVTGNIEHDGEEWSNSKTNIRGEKGQKEQYIKIKENGTIAMAILYPDITGSVYRWYKDGNPISGARQYTYTFNPLTLNEKGTYHCEADGQKSRDIIIMKSDPTNIKLLYFNANGAMDHILLNWETASEIDNAGFHIWRSERRDGEYTRITRFMIPSRGGPTAGAKYFYKDFNNVQCDPQSHKTFYYKLQDIGNSGHTNFHGPIKIYCISGSD